MLLDAAQLHLAALVHRFGMPPSPENTGAFAQCLMRHIRGPMEDEDLAKLLLKRGHGNTPAVGVELLTPELVEAGFSAEETRDVQDRPRAKKNTHTHSEKGHKAGWENKRKKTT